MRAMVHVAAIAALAIAGPSVSADAPATAIHLNQLGFDPDAPKRAIVADAATAPLPWRVIDTRGATVAQEDPGHRQRCRLGRSPP